LATPNFNFEKDICKKIMLALFANLEAKRAQNGTHKRKAYFCWKQVSEKIKFCNHQQSWIILLLKSWYFSVVRCIMAKILHVVFVISEPILSAS
jgi:hypothetical protein